MANNVIGIIAIYSGTAYIYSYISIATLYFYVAKNMYTIHHTYTWLHMDGQKLSVIILK